MKPVQKRESYSVDYRVILYHKHPTSARTRFLKYGYGSVLAFQPISGSATLQEHGSTHTAERDERWATLAIGYGDGLPRGLSNRGHALVRGRRVPIIGRISMDVTVVDISDAGPVEPGDIATLIGSDGGETITVDEVAGQVDTISYEVLTGFTPRVPRIWMDAHGS